MSNKIDISNIKQYLDGQLDAQSMHKLERQAQDDPFLMDAIEGYQRTGVKDPHLTDLQERLQQRLKRKEAKVITMGMIAIAASVVAVLTIGGLWYYNSVPQTEQQVAVRPDKTNVVPESIERPAGGNVIPNAILVDSAANVAVLRSAAPPALRRRKLAADNAELKPVNETAAAPQMFDGAGAAPQQKKQVDFREMAVMGYSLRKARKADSTSDQVSTKVAPGVLTEETGNARILMETTGAVRPKNAQPQNGWENYDQYIKDNSISPDALNGTVKVRFVVNADGTLSDIKVTKTLSPKADQKALDLITNGPKWIGGANGKPKSFTIKFKFRNE